MRKNLIAMILLSLMLLLGTSANAFAADDGSSGDKGKAYEYKVFVYAGNQGILKFNGKKEWSKTYENGGDVVTFSIDDVKVTNDKYMVRGFKLAGHDNDESYYTRVTFNGGGDVSYVVSYRIQGDMVPYKVNYVTKDGKKLGSDTYYGMIGDKPVISFKYFEGYVPNAYNLSKKLVGDPSQDVFTFTYSGGTAQNGNQNGQNANANANGNGAGIAANAPGTAGNPAGANTAAINNNGVPLADPGVPLSDPDVPQYVDLDENGGINWMLITAIAGGVLALIALLLLLLRKRRNQDDDLPEPPEDII